MGRKTTIKVECWAVNGEGALVCENMTKQIIQSHEIVGKIQSLEKL